MQRPLVAVAGFGDLGGRLAPVLRARGIGCAGLRRRVEELPPEVLPLPADLTDPATLHGLTDLQPEVLLFTPTPIGRGEAGYQAGFAQAARYLAEALSNCPVKHALLVSSTRVYAESTGAWIDESSALSTTDPCAQAIIDAEKIFLDAFEQPLILRAGGLYGKGPGHLLKRVAAGQLTPAAPLRYSNRMHRDDLIACIVHAIDGGCTGHRILNAVDDAPVPLQELERWLCGALGKDYKPPEEPGEPRSHKRVSNARLRDCGVALHYPDYRAGYGDVLRRWLAHSEREDSLDLH